MKMMTALRFGAASVASLALIVAATPSHGQDRALTPPRGVSPAVCGPGDTPESGIQGDVPAGATPSYSCGVRRVGQLPRPGNVQGVGQCVYIRSRGGEVLVVDVSDAANPREGGSIRVQGASETMRVAANEERAILVSGSSVYDVRDCLNPVHLGEIPWPRVTLPGIPQNLLPHDIRINRAATRVYASFGLWEANISNLQDSSSWTVTDHRCTLAVQQPGPWQEFHRQALAANMSLCADAAQANPRGANYTLGASPAQSTLMWPTLSHSPDVNGDDTYVYVGDQAGGSSGVVAPVAKVRIIDISQGAPRIVGEVDGPGHGLDWFRSGDREYVLHSNEGGSNGVLGQGRGADTCRPYPRPFSLGWGFDAFISDVTRPNRARNVSRLSLAINEPENCEARRASGADPWIAYHLIDNPNDATFAMVNFGSAGFRIFDIRNPARPVEVAYYNHGQPTHGGVGHYDASRGLIFAAGSDGLWVLELEPHVRARLGLTPPAG